MFDDFSIGEKGDMIGDLTGEAHFVGDENEVEAVGFEFFDEFEDFGGHFGIEGAGGFVE